MTWSTRELAERAATTVNTVRHYHRLGLLAEPRRRPNGYKQYDDRDLLQLLRVRRLAKLGVPLHRIGQVGASGEGVQDALRELDDELAAAIERLRRGRADISALLLEAETIEAPRDLQ